jgi:conjugal transfer pilus assembly protein TrbC
LLIFGGLANAQDNKPKSVAEYQAISDRALKVAMEHAALEKARKSAAPVTAPLLQPSALRKAPTVDPAEIADRYREFKSVALPPATDLLIFVSSSLPMPTLKRIGDQAAQAGAIVVFRGINDDLQKKGALARWVKYLDPLIKTGANVQINPMVFSRYQIRAVPAFVLATREEGCSSEQCTVASTVATGDVSLDYVLDHWAQKGDRFSAVAQQRLRKIRPEN